MGSREGVLPFPPTPLLPGENAASGPMKWGSSPDVLLSRVALGENPACCARAGGPARTALHHMPYPPPPKEKKKPPSAHRVVAEGASVQSRTRQASGPPWSGPVWAPSLGLPAGSRTRAPGPSVPGVLRVHFQQPVQPRGGQSWSVGARPTREGMVVGRAFGGDGGTDRATRVQSAQTDPRGLGLAPAYPGLGFCPVR